jgi:hypothetical protein
LWRRQGIPAEILAMLLVATYVFLMAIAVGMFVGAAGFPARHLGPAGPGFFPQLVAVCLFCLSAWGILQAGIEARAAPRSPARIPLRVLLGMGISIGYIVLMYFVGYFPSTLVYVFGILCLVRDESRAGRLALESAALTAIVFLFFRVIVRTYLPQGVLFE